MFGYSRKEALGYSISDLGILKGRAQKNQITSQLAQNSLIEGVEITVKNKSGRETYCLFSAVISEFGSVPYIICSAKNITEYRKIEYTLKSLAILTGAKTTAEFCIEIAGQLSQALGADSVFIHKIDILNKTVNKTYAAVVDGHPADDLECDLGQSVLDKIIAGERFYSTENACDIQKELSISKGGKINTLAACPVKNSSGSVIASISILRTDRFSDPRIAFKIVSV